MESEALKFCLKEYYFKYSYIFLPFWYFAIIFKLHKLCFQQETICIISETNNGFTCPEKAPTDEFGQFDPHPK